MNLQVLQCEGLSYIYFLTLSAGAIRLLRKCLAIAVITNLLLKMSNISQGSQFFRERFETLCEVKQLFTNIKLIVIQNDQYSIFVLHEESESTLRSIIIQDKNCSVSHQTQVRSLFMKLFILIIHYQLATTLTYAPSESKVQNIDIVATLNCKIQLKCFGCLRIVVFPHSFVELLR